jgi:hypothetical protein
MTETDPTVVFSTLRFLGKQLRTNQLRLSFCKRVRKDAEKNEDDARRTLRQIKLKIQREIDAHSKIIRQFPGLENVDE